MNNSQCEIGIFQVVLFSLGQFGFPTFVGIFVEFDRQDEGNDYDYDYDYDTRHLPPPPPHFPFASFPRFRLSLGMRDNETVSCPFCGQDNCLMIDGSVGSQRFTTDCEVCCRPFEVIVECEDGELLSVSTNG